MPLKSIYRSYVVSRSWQAASAAGSNQLFAVSNGGSSLLGLSLFLHNLLKEKSHVNFAQHP